MRGPAVSGILLTQAGHAMEGRRYARCVRNPRGCEAVCDVDAHSCGFDVRHEQQKLIILYPLTTE